jgi:acyl-CoA reductase-like NAD-dependent aldehyde dehydrogenase
LITGDPFDHQNTLGAIICKEQFEKIISYINEGKK